MKKTTETLTQRLYHYSNRPWYGAFIASLAAADAFIFVISMEAILFPSVLAHPKKWISTAVWLTFGSAVGATLFAYLANFYGEDLVRQFFPHLFETEGWGKTHHFIDHYGIFGMTFVSFSPFPQHVAVAVAGLAHMKPISVFLAVFIGRGLKYLPLAWMTTHTPGILKKLHLISQNYKKKPRPKL